MRSFRIARPLAGLLAATALGVAESPAAPVPREGDVVFQTSLSRQSRAI